MNAEHPFTILPLGDSALILSFGNVIDENINKKILVLFHKIKSLSLNGVKDIVPSYSSLAIHYDVFIVKQKSLTNKTAFEIIAEEIKIIAEENDQIDLSYSRKIKVPVCYAEKYALDMNEISLEKKLSATEIISLHTGKKYRVYMIGFLPGFAYMGKVDDKLIMPRKAQPRLKVEAGYVGIAGKQTGIYPLTSPGGWQIIGKTPLKLFDKEIKDPVLFQPGDEIEFYSISEDEFTNY
jgi:inhibitor of KinA